MKVILLQDVKGVGKVNTVCNVKDGFAVNYLIPQKMAVYYNDKNEKDLEQKLALLNKQEQENIQKATELKDKIEQLTLTFSLKEFHGVAFGSISQKQIVEKLKENNINVLHTNFNGQIKLGLGEHVIQIKLYKHIVASLKVNVIAEAK